MVKRYITEFLIKDLDKGSKAVSGARSIADNVVVMGVSISIDTNHISRDVSFSRSSDENLLSSCCNVPPGTFSVHKHSGSFNHQVYPQLPAISITIFITWVSLPNTLI